MQLGAQHAADQGDMQFGLGLQAQTVEFDRGRRRTPALRGDGQDQRVRGGGSGHRCIMPAAVRESRRCGACAGGLAWVGQKKESKSKSMLRRARALIRRCAPPSPAPRSDELRVGKEGASTCRYRWTPETKK